MEYYTGQDYGPKAGMVYTQVMPQPGFRYVYDQDGRRYSVPVQREMPIPGNPGISPIENKIPTDEEIREKGFKFIPDQKYLKTPFMLPVDEEPVVDKGIVATNAFNDGPVSFATKQTGVDTIGASPFTDRAFNTQMFETGPYANPYGKTLADYKRNPMLDPLNQKIVEKLREDKNLDSSYTDEELIDMYGNQNFEDSEEEFSFTDYIPFVGDKSLFTGIMSSVLPEQDLRATNIRDYYGGQDNLSSAGTIQSGLMAGYNPVSGGLMIGNNFDAQGNYTGGAMGNPTRYGLQRAYQKRLDTIAKTERRKGGLSPELLQRRADLQAAKAEELQSLQRAQREKDYNTIQDAYESQTGAGSSYSGGMDRRTGNYDDPFAPGDAD